MLRRIPNTRASSPPGTLGANRSTANKSTSAPAPIASVAPLVSPRCPIRWMNCLIVSPDPFSIPNSFGSWLTVTKIARPNTNPSITGRDRNCATNPSRNKPAIRSRPPQKITSPAASDMYRVASVPASPPTEEASSTAAADVAAATRCRLVPNSAYAASVTSNVYRPA